MEHLSQKDGELMVTIRCLAYNHEPYIRQCLEGFVMQKTNFRFEAIVHDDASTDGTAAIIREYAEKYPDIIKPIFETENQYSKRDGSIRRIMNEHTHGKYVAMCEGDDYWIDPLKLQKQVDFLEENPTCSLVVSNGMMYNVKQNKTTIINPLGNIDSRYVSIDELFEEKGGLIPTASMMYRRNLYLNMPDFFFLAPVGDRPLRMWLALNGKVYYMSESTITYRLGSIGSFNQRISNNCEYAKKLYEQMIEYYDKYDEYTDGQYHTVISSMKDRERYIYCIRSQNILSSFKTDYFRKKSLIVRYKQYIKYVIKLFYNI